MVFVGKWKTFKRQLLTAKVQRDQKVHIDRQPGQSSPIQLKLFFLMTTQSSRQVGNVCSLHPSIRYPLVN